MKSIFFLLAVISLSFASYSQTKGAIKLYGFKQSVSGGRAPDIAEGASTRTSGGGAGKNYFIYATSPSRIYPLEMWIEGVQYGVTISSITKTPVEYSDEANIGSQKTVLVPKTSEKSIQLIPVPVMGNKSTGTKAKSLATTNELVVVYKQNGKFYYTALKSLSGLKSAAMQ
ncbi:MAG: hypothetical protein JWR72_1545 [Flavisolibacter sp.]|jgi:hypothetical protein|nr:hypothetical protein [Flavisolibacter sp.]